MELAQDRVWKSALSLALQSFCMCIVCVQVAPENLTVFEMK
jgi:hypothetical protein